MRRYPPASPDPSMAPKLGYRPEFDGLRGIAVLLVLGYHVHLPLFAGGGGVGVSLFFALSGYLITRLLLDELGATGRISMRSFYSRRARRLLPALVAVVAVTGLANVIAPFGDFPTQAAVVLLNVSNVARALGTELGFLGHAWSLSMEEQFYFVWPALLLFVPRRALLPTAIVAIVWSLAAQVALANDPNATYRPDVRADEILWGCVVALTGIRAGLPVLFASIVVDLFATVTGAVPFFGVIALASAGIVAGAHHLGPLGNRVLVRVGKVSYGLYLWQALPTAAVLNLTLDGNVVAIAFAITASFVLALASERWIEAPFRARRRSDPEPVALEPVLGVT